jgi:hypothetical protein
MQEYRFWANVSVNGLKQRREFVFTAASWTEARRMMSAAMRQPIPA